MTRASRRWPQWTTISCERDCVAARCDARRSRGYAAIWRQRDSMPKKPPKDAADLIPDHPTIARVRAEAKECTACDLYKRGTQTVFGEGAARAPLMLVGEQPGDAEDLAGRPFVGPAGRL